MLELRPNCELCNRDLPPDSGSRAPRGRQPCPPSSIDAARARALQRGGNTRLRKRRERCSSGKALMKHFGYEAAALLAVDVQQGLDEPSLGQRNNPQAEACMANTTGFVRPRRLLVT